MSISSSTDMFALPPTRTTVALAGVIMLLLFALACLGMYGTWIWKKGDTTRHSCCGFKIGGLSSQRKASILKNVEMGLVNTASGVLPSKKKNTEQADDWNRSWSSDGDDVILISTSLEGGSSKQTSVDV